MKREHYQSQGRKWFPLVMFVILNSALIIALRYSAIHINAEHPVISSTEVLFAEVLKLVLSLMACFIIDAKFNIKYFLESLWKGFVEEDGDILKLCVPALLYTIQNNLQYVIESGTLFLVLYQFKIISTAVFYSTMLSRRIYGREWWLICALAVGVGIVESSQHDIQIHHASNVAGIISVVVAIVTSGFAGVYFELILKASKSSIWVINVQLSLLGCLYGTTACMAQNTEELGRQGFFIGHNVYTVTVIILQAFVGLVIALVVKYADNIHKGFASSVSIVLSTILDSFLFDDVELNTVFNTGSAIVFLSTVGFIIHSSKSRPSAAGPGLVAGPDGHTTPHFHESSGSMTGGSTGGSVVSGGGGVGSGGGGSVGGDGTSAHLRPSPMNRHTINSSSSAHGSAMESGIAVKLSSLSGSLDSAEAPIHRTDSECSLDAKDRSSFFSRWWAGNVRSLWSHPS